MTMLKVLVIDDAVHIRRLIVRMLNRAGVTTLEANDGVEGLELVKTHQPDVITCDIAMPFMDGYEFLETVKADPDLSHIPIIIITALGQLEETIKATELGANACITKPFSSSFLLEVINAHVEQTIDTDAF